jgi:hypothetical protein
MAQQTPLELAMASPDPAVRGLALHRQQLQAEMDRVDGFFANYAALHEVINNAPTTVPTTPPKAVPEVRKQPKKSTGTALDRDQRGFVPRVAGIIRRNGGAMRLTDLEEAMRQDFPDMVSIKSESFRKRLFSWREMLPFDRETRTYSVSALVPAD